jgi:hypothetical protein
MYRWVMEIEIYSELILSFFIRRHLSVEASQTNAGHGWANFFDREVGVAAPGCGLVIAWILPFYGRATTLICRRCHL